MTLIELMVVIVILVTLVAGVLPLVSPNNDARKINDAARSLQTYFMQAQSEAQRLGRPVGVGFRESAPGSGVALEVFQLAVPKPFTGPTISSMAIVRYPIGQYGDSNLFPDLPDAQGGRDFIDLYAGREVYSIRFVRSPLKKSQNGPEMIYEADVIPHGMFKVGDIANLEGNLFLIVDTEYNKRTLGYRNAEDPNVEQEYPGNSLGFSDFHGVWINDNGQALRTIPIPSNDPGVPKTYAVHRQPTTDKFGVSSESPYQLPTGVAIDLQASGVEGLGVPETFAEISEVDASYPDYDPPSTPYQKQIGIMFSPQGGIDGVWVNDGTVAGSASARSGFKLTDVSRIFLMLGRVENQNPPADTFTIVKQNGSMAGDYTDDDIRDIRSKVNWLNPDSRWVMINAQNGRVGVVQNQMFDPREPSYYVGAGQMSANLMDQLGGWSEACKIAQIEAAHGEAHGHHNE